MPISSSTGVVNMQIRSTKENYQDDTQEGMSRKQIQKREELVLEQFSQLLSQKEVDLGPWSRLHSRNYTLPPNAYLFLSYFSSYFAQKLGLPKDFQARTLHK